MSNSTANILGLSSNTQAPSNAKPCASCTREIPIESAICPFCGKSQVMQTVSPVQPNKVAPIQASNKQDSNFPFIEFRASDNIWSFEEREPPVPPEQRRPVLILDEETILLKETHKYIPPDELLSRVRSIIAQQNVPVEAIIAKARWLNDYMEVRPRIVASLKNHAYSGVKMILGLDYMGNWANLQFQIGMQPDPIPKPPATATGNPLPILLILGGLFLGFIGFVAAALGSALGYLLLLAGIAGLVGGVYMHMQIQQQVDVTRREREKYEREQYQQNLYKARMSLFRTYKIDDVLLFREAMRAVFERVVDDIIEQGGGEKVREIKGGNNELFEKQATAHAAPQNAQDTTQIAHQPLSDQVKSAVTTVAKHQIKQKTGFEV
jgi:hypothetical protein